MKVVRRKASFRGQLFETQILEITIFDQHSRALDAAKEFVSSRWARRRYRLGHAQRVPLQFDQFHRDLMEFFFQRSRAATREPGVSNPAQRHADSGFSSRMNFCAKTGQLKAPQDTIFSTSAPAS